MKRSSASTSMRARPLFATFSMASIVIAGGAWLACVGDDATVTSGTGAQDAAPPTTSSSSGGTSSGSSTSSSGGIEDGGTDAGADADAAAIECRDLGDVDYPRCPVGTKLETCSSAKPDCCPSAGCGASTASCDPYNGLFECFGTPACRRDGGTDVCCLTATLKDAGGSCSGAPNQITKQTATITHCLSACDVGEVRLCAKADGGRDSCPVGQKCELASLRFADGLVQVVPVCTP